MENQITSDHIDTLLHEQRLFPPKASFQANANIKDAHIYEEAKADPETFWANEAKKLEWMQPWDQVLDWQPPYAKWFVNGKLNASVNCLDRHIRAGHGQKTALIWEGEPGEVLRQSYDELLESVCRLANGLKKLGVKKGDRIAIYLPMIPELVISVLACARIGAVHSVVFGGFSQEALRDRIEDAEAHVVITADGGYRRGKILDLKSIADEACKQCACLDHVVVVNRLKKPLTLGPKDCAYHELVADEAPTCEPEVMDSEDLLFLLYTSGTTGKPKGIMHTTGGYLTGVTTTSRNVLDLQAHDVFWCTADVGWITGHSYLVYGPLSNGATVFMYEGSPDTPDYSRLWQLVEKHKITIFYTAPTAIRMFMKWGAEWIQKQDLTSLRLLGTVGEPINPEVWMWYRSHIGLDTCPIVDTWWQTETGSIMIAPLPGVTATRPGSATFPQPGISVEVVNEDGDPVSQGEGGLLVISKPYPSMLRGIYGDADRFVSTYWSKFKDKYLTGDGARIDKEGYVWLLGRVDDVLNVSGHRLGTAEVESALVDHPKVTEAAVVGMPHEIKGEVPCAFVTLEGGKKGDHDLEQELTSHVASVIGSIAKPNKLIFTSDLPKTRSGKIMRRLLRNIATGKTMGDTSTLSDPSVVAQLAAQYEQEEG